MDGAFRMTKTAVLNERDKGGREALQKTGTILPKRKSLF